MNKILVPTEFTYLSKCALQLGLELAELGKTKIQVLSVVESNENMYMEKSERFHNHPMSSIKNIQLTETARERMHQRVVEIAEWAPELTLPPKIVFGNRTQVLIQEAREEAIDMIIMGGDLYEPADREANEFLRAVSTPVLILKCMISQLNQFKDIIFLADLDNDSSELIRHLKKLQHLLSAKLHVLRVNTPRNFLSFQKCKASLESYAKKYQLENFELITKDARSELAGLMDYCEAIKHAFVASAVHERSFLRSLMNNKDDMGEMIANSVHPLWMFKN